MRCPALNGYGQRSETPLRQPPSDKRSGGIDLGSISARHIAIRGAKDHVLVAK
jgi:hypothetical protein